MARAPYRHMVRHADLLFCHATFLARCFIHSGSIAYRTDWPGMTKIAAEERPKTDAMRAELRDIFATQGPKLV